MKEKKEKAKGGERLVRLLMLGLGAVLALWLVEGLAGQQANFPQLSEWSVEKLEPQKILSVFTQEESGETEPITKPVGDVQTQTQLLIEMIKKLPEDQLQAVKEQVYKEFCQDYCQEFDQRNEE